MPKKYNWYLKIGALMAGIGITGEFVGFELFGRNLNEILELAFATGGLYLCFWTVAKMSLDHNTTKAERVAD
ncbi:MAG: hypothetical protein HKN47_07665 [Pirellulaceae bacterium]|nr:hypothetical protein [Pirellulaceae bacterium]